MQRQIDIHSDVRPFPIHTDEAWSRAKGFRTTIAPGMMSTAYVSTLKTMSIGEGFVQVSCLGAFLLRPYTFRRIQRLLAPHSGRRSDLGKAGFMSKSRAVQGLKELPTRVG